jgi:dihydroneopterin aldolase
MNKVLAMFPAHAISLKIVKPNILPNAQTVAVAMYQEKS